MANKHYLRLFLGLTVLLLTACDSDPRAKNEVDRDPSVPPPPEGIKVVTTPDKQVRMLTPYVQFDDGVMNVTGYVRRKPGVKGVIAGRIDIDVFDSDGTLLDWVPAILTPASLPTTGRGESGYIIHYGWIPPQGSTIKVRYVDPKTAMLEDSADSEAIGGTYGSHTGGHGNGHASAAMHHM